MRIFLTGGTGYVGSAVLDAFVRAGHQVQALVRNREKATAIQARGAHPILGDLARPETYAPTAALADGVIHTAIDHSTRDGAHTAAKLDALVIESVLAPGRAAE